MVLDPVQAPRDFETRAGCQLEVPGQPHFRVVARAVVARAALAHAGHAPLNASLKGPSRNPDIEAVGLSIGLLQAFR